MLWIKAVDKSVDNVENSRFSTGIFWFCLPVDLHEKCIIGCI